MTQAAGNGVAVNLLVPHDEVGQHRLAFATAPNRSAWEQAFEETRSLLGRPPRNDADRLQIVHLAALAAYQHYLAGPPLRDALKFIDRAEQVARHVESGVDHLRAGIALARARHRLARNAYLVPLLRQSRATLDRLVPKLRRAEPRADELINWQLELANWHRYRGFSTRAQRIYGGLLGTLDRLPQAPTQMLRVCALLHYQVSVYCDFLELAALPYPSSQGKWRSFATKTSRAMEKSLLVPAAQAALPLLGAYNQKHAALVSAIRGNHEAAREQLAEATRIVGDLKLTKPVLLCDLFRVLVDGFAQRRTEAILQLEDIVERARDYYPRAASKALLYAAQLQSQMEQPEAAQKTLRRRRTEFSTGLMMEIESRYVEAEASAIEQGLANRTAQGASGPPRTILEGWESILETQGSNENVRRKLPAALRRWVHHRKQPRRARAPRRATRSLDGIPSLKERIPGKGVHPVPRARHLDLELAAGETSEKILARLSSAELADLAVLDHGDRSDYEPLDIDGLVRDSNSRLLARLSAQELADLAVLDHGDRSDYEPFDLDGVARQ